MIKVRKSKDRGHAHHGWLDTYYTFSFANYYDPEFTGFRDLLVINEDRIQPAKGFGKHPHQDMEIITYVLEGELEHKDSMGNGSVIRPGDVQRMSAGRGVMHSEFNHSQVNPVHLLQIWITPRQEGLDPSYEEKRFLTEQKRNRMLLIVSANGQDGSVRINQDAQVFASVLDQGKSTTYDFELGRHGWIQVTRGSIKANGVYLEAGDGAAISDERQVEVSAGENSEFLFFDLP